MRARKFLRILSSATGRTLSCTLGRRACTDSFFGGRKSDNTWSGLWHTEAKSALSAFEQICLIDGASSGRYPSRSILSKFEYKPFLKWNNQPKKMVLADLALHLGSYLSVVCLWMNLLFI